MGAPEKSSVFTLALPAPKVNLDGIHSPGDKVAARRELLLDVASTVKDSRFIIWAVFG
jgi:hypothetical protein